MASRKAKSHSGASKRFKKTGTGRYLYKAAGRRHLLSSKSRSRKRRISGTSEVAPGQQQMMSRVLPN